MTIEIKRSYYDNGQLQSEIPYQNKQRHGITKRWHKNGKLQAEISHHKGQCHDVARWYENGQLETEHSYYEGNHHGISKSWHNDGRVMYEKYYLHGLPVTHEKYQTQNPTTTSTSNEVVCTCGKTADVGCPCWWCGGKN